jgi:uncharacterized protein YjdB
MKKHFCQFAAVLAAITLAVIVAGCGGDKKDIPVTSVTLSDASKSLVMGRGDDDAGFSLTATVMPANASRRNVTWSVDAEGIVELSSTTGASITVKPKAGGTARITATADGETSDECVVKVTAAEDYVAVEGVSLDLTSKTLMVSEPFTIKATLDPPDATIQGVTWEVKEGAGYIEELEPDGLTVRVKGKAVGTAVVKVTTEDGGEEAECTITVILFTGKHVTGVTLNVTEKTLDIDEAFELTATVQPPDAAIKGVTWSLDGDDVVELSADTGETVTVTAIALGTAVVTVTTDDGDFTADAVITVENGTTGPTSYTVTFHSNGGSAVDSITVKKDDKVDEPVGVTGPSTELEEGLYLGGWYTDAGLTCKWDFATDKVTADTDLYAGWFPKLSTEKWTRIGPTGITIEYVSQTSNPYDTEFHFGMALDHNSNTIYQTVGSQTPSLKNGIIRSTDRGATWEWVYDSANKVPINIRVDPADPNILYLIEAYNNADKGFLRSKDGGKTWEQPAGFVSFIQDNNLLPRLYHIELDPNDRQHLLITTGVQNGWDSKGWAGAESFDGGDTWAGVKKPSGLNSGWEFNMWFIYNPLTKTGADGKRFLLGTRDNSGAEKGFYLTADGGDTWTHVGPNLNMYNDGGGVYYGPDGTLYLACAANYAGSGAIMQSGDDGETWTAFIDSGDVGNHSFRAVIAYGDSLYTADHGQFWITEISGGPDWKKNEPKANNNGYDDILGFDVMTGGAFEFSLDPANKILYASCINSGLYALQLE